MRRRYCPTRNPKCPCLDGAPEAPRYLFQASDARHAVLTVYHGCTRPTVADPSFARAILGYAQRTAWDLES